MYVDPNRGLIKEMELYCVAHCYDLLENLTESALIFDVCLHELPAMNERRTQSLAIKKKLFPIALFQGNSTCLVD